MTAMASNKGSSIRARLSGQARLVSSVRAGRLLFRREVGLNLTHPLARKNTPGVVRAGGSDLSSLFDGTGSSKESKNEAKDDGEVKEVELNSEVSAYQHHQPQWEGMGQGVRASLSRASGGRNLRTRAWGGTKPPETKRNEKIIPARNTET